MNPLTDLSLLSGAPHLEHRLRQGSITTPIHPPDGSTIFVWEGRAESVELQTWMPGFPATPPFQRLGGSDIWVLALRLPATAMIEYRIAVVRAGRRQEMIDPLNPVVAGNPFGTNSVAAGPRYRRPDWSLPRDGIPRGRVSDLAISSAVWGRRVGHLLYVPASGPEAGPVLVVHDGEDFWRHSGLATVLDNLIAAGTIPPLVALLHRPGDRIPEYGGSRRHEAHILDEALPLIRRRHRIGGGLIALGSSMGAVAALGLGWHHPDQVNGLALLSGSFANHLAPDRPAEIFAPVVDLVGVVGGDRRMAGTPTYVSCGRYEGLVDLNRALVPRLRSGGLKVRYEEVWEGHNWASWRDRLRAALVWAVG